MSERTGIEWTDATWSPWWGCTQVSPACDHCYAMALDKRTGGAHWGTGVPRKQMSEKHWTEPRKWDRTAAREGVRRTVFPSMCDPFDNEVPASWRARFFGLMRDTPHLTWLLLSKRIGNAAAMCERAGGLPPNAALGATVVTQAEADRDVPKLLGAGGAITRRFVSIEPMLEAINLAPFLVRGDHGLRSMDPLAASMLSAGEADGLAWVRPRIDWVICGGESGPHARPMHPDWPRSLRDQCASAGVPFFFKQWGEWAPVEPIYSDDDTIGGWAMRRIGKARAGCLLDGAEHKARPELGE